MNKIYIYVIYSNNMEETNFVQELNIVQIYNRNKFIIQVYKMYIEEKYIHWLGK